MKRIAKGALAACAAAVLVAGPALGLESLTGVYQGKIKCRGLLGGSKVKGKVDVEVQVSDGLAGLALSIDELGTFEGYAVTDVKKPERGSVVAVSCALSIATLDGAMLSADAKIKAGSAEGSLKGTVFLAGDETGDARRCDLDVKRISTASPMIVVCP